MANRNINGLKGLLDRKVIRLTDAQVEEYERQVAELEDSAYINHPPVPPTANLELIDNRDIAAGLPFNEPLNAETVARVELELGRKLDQDEIRLGRIKREYSIRPKQIFTDEDVDAQLDRDIAEMEKAVEAERVHNMTDAQRDLYDIMQVKKQREAKAANEQIAQEHAVKVAGTLERLAEIRRDMLVNPFATAEDFEIVDSAYLMIGTPGHNEGKANELLVKVVAMGPKHLTEKRQALTDKLIKSGLTETEASAIAANRFPYSGTDKLASEIAANGFPDAGDGTATASAAATSSKKKAHRELVESLKAKAEEAQAAAEQAFSAFKNSDAESQQAARQKWYDADDAKDAAWQTYVDTENAASALD